YPADSTPSTTASRFGQPQVPAAAEPADRVTREAAPILARLDTNPTDPHLYLQLSAVYRRGNQPDRARAVLEQGLAPTANDFRLTIELMEMDLDTWRRNLAVAERKLAKAEADEDYKHTPEEMRKIRSKIIKEIGS